MVPTEPPKPASDKMPDHDHRLAAARARAAWELGSEVWADVLVRAYLDPERDRESLKRDMEE